MKGEQMVYGHAKGYRVTVGDPKEVGQVLRRIKRLRAAARAAAPPTEEEEAP